MSVGFIRDFEDSFVGTYLERDMGYARFTYLFGGQFLLVAEVRAGGVFFPNNPDFGQPNGWSDFRLDGTLFGEWRITDWFAVNADFHASTVSFASAGRITARFGINRSDITCSTGSCVGPSSPTAILSCVQTQIDFRCDSADNRTAGRM